MSISRGTWRKSWSCISDAAERRGRNQRCFLWPRNPIESRQPLRRATEFSFRTLSGGARCSRASERASVLARVPTGDGADTRQGCGGAACRSRSRDARRRLPLCRRVGERDRLRQPGADASCICSRVRTAATRAPTRRSRRPARAGRRPPTSEARTSPQRRDAAQLKPRSLSARQKTSSN